MRGATALVSATRPHPGRWSDSTFIDERHERLLAGQLVAHPERLIELRVGEEVFHSSRLTLFRIMRRRADAGLPTDLEAMTVDLVGAGLLGFAADLEEEWWAYPLGLRELERRVGERWLRRKLNVLGEQLIVAARDASLPIDYITTTVAEVRAALGVTT